MPLMSFAEYARHRGVSKAAVTYAIRDGRIRETTNHDGKRCIDSEEADLMWSKNTAHDQRRNTGDLPGQAPSFPAEKISNPAPVQIGFDRQALNLPEVPALGAQSDDGTYSKARAVKEHYAAKTAELEFLERSGKLLALETVTKRWTDIASIVRTKILAVPSKCRQRIPDLTDDQYFVLENVIREALEDLSSERG